MQSDQALTRSRTTKMLSPQKQEKLAAFLAALPVSAAARLFQAIELDRRTGGDGLPHDLLLADLRAKLLDEGAALPARPLTAKRFFFSPFEDFFVSRRDGAKRRAQIDRSSLDAVWRLMMTETATTEAALAAATFDDATAGGEDPHALAKPMFLAAEAGLSRLVAQADDDDDTRLDLIRLLGGEAAYEDLREIRYLLAGVTLLTRLQELMPGASPTLDEERYFQIRTLFLEAHDRSRTLAGYLLLALKGRLEKPWRALGLYYHLNDSADKNLFAARESIAMLGEALFEDIEALARDLEDDCADPLDARAALAKLDYFADYTDGLNKFAAKAGDNVFVNRIEACREIGAEALDRFAEQALGALRAATPVRHAGGSARLMSLRPDFSQALNARQVDHARRAAALLAQAGAIASRLGADADFATSLAEEAREKLRVYGDDLVAEIRAAEGDERRAARRMLEHVLEFSEALLTSEETGLLRDRAAAAAVTA